MLPFRNSLHIALYLLLRCCIDHTICPGIVATIGICSATGWSVLSEVSTGLQDVLRFMPQADQEGDAPDKLDENRATIAGVVDLCDSLEVRMC